MSKQIIRRVFSGIKQWGNLAVVEISASQALFNDTQRLQNLAIINQQSISVFIIADEPNELPSPLLSYSIRWFSPTTEVSLCGHGALAAADLILSTKNLSKGNTRCIFSNKAITVQQIGLNQYILYLPTIELFVTSLCLSLSSLFTDKILAVMQTMANNGYLIIALKNETAVKLFDFDECKYSALTQRALIVTCISKDEPDVIFFRYFAPQYGEKEDNATGSAAPILAEFWQLLFGKRYHCEQLSLTGGYFQVVRGDKEIKVVATVCDV